MLRPLVAAVALVLATGCLAASDFVIVGNGFPDALILLPPGTPTCLQYAARDLIQDCYEATGRRLRVVSSVSGEARAVICPLVVDQSDLLTRLERKGLLTCAPLRGKWETYLLQPLPHPLPGTGSMLVVAGSDPRGAMYGLYELSERAFATDPMKLWTGHRPTPRSRAVFTGTLLEGPPTFKYRGFFINDEDFLRGWLKTNTDYRVLEHAAYEQILETICRCKGNLLAPAMQADYMSAETRKLVSDRGLVYTASHLETLLSNPQNYWRRYCAEHWGGYVDYSYGTQRARMEQFWRDSVRYHRPYESIWPLALRGLGDTPFWTNDPFAPKDSAARAELTSRAVTDQLQLLKSELGPEAKPLTSWTMYNEVLDLYRTGKLKVPDEVMLIWPDDNHGHLRSLPGPQERQRSGGNGVYYHLTFCDNQWVQWIPLEMIRDEFKAVVDSGATDYVLHNVGDLREVPLSVAAAMDLAWDATPWLADRQTPGRYLRQWTAYHFGGDAARQAAHLYRRFYELERQAFSQPTLTRAWQQLDALVQLAEATGVPAALGGFGPGSASSGSSALYARLEQLRPRWDALYRRALALGDQVSDDGRQFYHDDLLLQVQTSRLVNACSLALRDAQQALSEGSPTRSAALLERAAGCMDTIAREREEARHGKWQTWYAHEFASDWGLRPAWRAQRLRQIAELVRNAAQTAAGAQVLRLNPSVFDVMGPVGTHCDCTATLATAPGAQDSAVLYVMAYDTDSPEEAAVTVNGVQHPLGETGDSKTQLMALTIPSSELRAGENVFSFVFRDSLGGSTRGFSVYGAALALQPVATVLEVEAERPTRLISPMVLEKREDASGGACLLIPQGVGGEGGEGGPGAAEYRFEVERAGGYLVWVRAWWEDGAANSFLASIDGEGKWTLGNTNDFKHWVWVASGPRRLTAGRHLLRLSNREDGARADRVVITTSRTPPAP
ncbi:MAG: glycosyl hydrolase 115 family protein [Armatimonadia bacterium]